MSCITLLLNSYFFSIQNEGENNKILVYQPKKKAVDFLKHTNNMNSLTPTEKIKHLEKQARIKKWANPKLRCALSFVLAVVLLISGTTAYFTDRAQTITTGTAGTVQIDFDSSGVNLLNADGMDILNPGDARDVEFVVKNVGNKSTDIKVVATLTSSVEMSNNHRALKYLPVYEIPDENLFDGNVYFSEYELYNKDHLIYTEGYGYYPKKNTWPLDKRTFDTFNPNRIVYVLDEVTLSGNSTLDEREIEYDSENVELSDVLEYNLALLFDPHSSNRFQNSNVTIKIEVWAKQHRNTEGFDWIKMEELVYTSLKDSLFTVNYNGLHELEITGVVNQSEFESTADIVIPEGVQLVPDQFFFFNSTMETVTLPSTLKRTGMTAFAWCTSLQSAYFEDGLTTLGDATFSSCTNLTDVRLPNTLKTIGDSAFYRCSSLTSIELPDGLTKIQNSAFADSGLTAVSIPESVTVIESGAFKNCLNLESVILPSHMTEIPDDIFENCPNLQNIIIR